jgi:hypothetical protein
LESDGLAPHWAALGFFGRQLKRGPSLGYRVEFTAEIGPKEVKARADYGEGTLTLVTGSPSYFVGPPPRNLLLRARNSCKAGDLHYMRISIARRELLFSYPLQSLFLPSEQL